MIFRVILTVICVCRVGCHAGVVMDGFSRLSLFFFFQAEDGIRVTSVTGVQTCALPIFVWKSGTQIAVLWVPLFQKIKPLRLRNASRWALLSGIPRHPHASALAASRFAHQPQLVFAGNRRRVYLNKLAVRVIDALLKERGLCRTRAYY